ncbi:Rna-Binding Protein 27 [Manis pentadactyla]|nr:Rna-Binding Protein 27 [Manis pentadactyla]
MDAETSDCTKEGHHQPQPSFLLPSPPPALLFIAPSWASDLIAASLSFSVKCIFGMLVAPTYCHPGSKFSDVQGMH